jgi:CTP:molybdopterin cytidylyltransferase MocA
MSPHILILAAGSSSRMRGGDKLLERVEGAPLLARIARLAQSTDLPVTVTLPPDRPLRDNALAGMGLDTVTVPGAALGMAESLKAGVAALPDTAAVMLLLADLPEMTADDLGTMLQAWAQTPDLILRGADAAGRPGHPVCFPAWARGELLALTGDQGAREVLLRHKDRTRLIPLPGQHATTDLDTPEEWAAWRAAGRNL